MLFQASIKYDNVELSEDNCYEINNLSEVQLGNDSWANVKTITVGDIIKLDDNSLATVIKVEHTDNMVKLYIKEVIL